MNWAIIVTFDDGLEWIFRSPHSGIRAFFDEKTACKLLASEVATLEYVRSHTAVPVPEVFASRCGSLAELFDIQIIFNTVTVLHVKMTLECCTSL